jgi:hypothetical protein
MSQITLQGVFNTITCCHEGCHVTFAVSEDLYQRRRNDRGWFYCPNGHRQYFTAETEAEKLQRLLNNANQQNAMYAGMVNEEREAHAKTLRSLRSQKAAKTLLKRRVASGKCPCCSEHFTNLERHMKAAHPDGKVVPIKRRA